MKAMTRTLILLTAILFATGVFARNTIASYSVKTALSSDQAKKATVGTHVKFYFGNQPHGGVTQTFGQIKTNNF